MPSVEFDLPMFPLGTVVMPGQTLSLQVFEPRYRKLVGDVVKGATGPVNEFGIVLIERGSEVGGGDVRFPVGCLTHIVQAQPTPDGRIGLVVAGVKRIAIQEWLSDRPYPYARVAEIESVVVAADRDIQADARGALIDVLAAFNQPFDARAWPSDGDAFGDAVVARLGMTALDAQRVLSEDRVGVRLEIITGMLRDAIADLRLRQQFEQ